MLQKLKEKCLNYETVSYIVCGVLTTAVDFVSYSLFRKSGISVELSQGLSWVAAVLFAYVAEHDQLVHHIGKQHSRQP